jgi:hypothetical protein
MPPIFSTMPMAIGAVTDLGARERTTLSLAPRSQASPLAVTMDVRAPARMPARMGILRDRISRRRT